MNKKYMAFGLLAFFALALVSAVLVPYLSNYVEGDVTIESPLALTGDFSLVVPHSMNVIDTTLTNNADFDIGTIVEVSIEATDEGDSFLESNFGAEFETLSIGMIIPGVNGANCIDGTYDLYGDFYEDGYCYWNADYDRSFTGILDGIYYVQMGDGTVPISAGETLDGRVKLRFHEAVLGDFTIKAQAVTLDGAKNLA